MSKGHTLQDPFLNTLRKERIPVSIYLANGIKLQGHVESFDQFVILLKNSVSQLVYKHAISTIVPPGTYDCRWRKMKAMTDYCFGGFMAATNIIMIRSSAAFNWNTTEKPPALPAI